MRSMEELIQSCREHGFSMPRAILQAKEQETGQSREKQLEIMNSRLLDMRASVEEALGMTRHPTLVDNRAPLLGRYTPENGPLAGVLVL